MSKTTTAWVVLPKLTVLDEATMTVIEEVLGEGSAKHTAETINKVLGGDYVEAKHCVCTPASKIVLEN